MTAPFDPERFRRIDALFDAALEHSAEDRPAWLDQMCAGDVALRTEIESLLESVDTAESAIGEHVGDFAAQLIADLGAAHTDPVLAAGTRLGPWRIVREIGRGGMGIVYEAERADDAFRLRVAIKVVKRGMDTGEVLRRFHAERRILAALDDPRIARVIDGGAAPDGRPYLVMEHVEGVPIDRWCADTALDERGRVALLGEVCAAVHQAHRRLVVHRDVKPSNVLITADGTPKLLDFGIAKLLDDDDPAATMTLARALTPAYAAPEQKRDDPVTTAADVYSLGVLLHELLTGVRPAESGVGVAGDLGTIISRATAPEPERRYASALQLAEDLDRWLRGMPVLARPDSFGYRATMFVKRNALAVTGAAAALVLLLAFSVAMTRAQARTADALARAESERETAEEVAGLLEQIFAGGDPLAPRPERLDTMRVAALLDRGVAQVRDSLSERPAVQARLLRALGDAYRGLGMFPRADTLLRAAVTLQRTTADPIPLADALASLGLLELERGRSADAGPWLEEAIAIRRAHRTEPATLVRLLSNLAATRQDANNMDGAAALYDEAERLIVSGTPPDTGLLATVLNGRAQMAVRAGDFEQAAAVAGRILAINRIRLGETHPRIAIDMVNIALMHQRLGRSRVADSIQTEAVELLRTTMGEDHPRYIIALAELANIRAQRGLHDDAAAMFERAIASMRRTMGGTPDLAITLSQYADLLHDRGDFQNADLLLTEAIDIERRARGDGSPGVAITQGQLATMKCMRGDIDAANDLFGVALTAIQRALPAQHPRVIDMQRRYGECLTSAGRYDDAERQLVTSLETLEAAPGGPITPDAVRAALVRLYEAWGRPADADRYR